MKSVDSTGAGDAFIGSFATFLGEGLPERDAVMRANLYAGLSTTGWARRNLSMTARVLRRSGRRSRRLSRLTAVRQSPNSPALTLHQQNFFSIVNLR